MTTPSPAAATGRHHDANQPQPSTPSGTPRRAGFLNEPDPTEAVKQMYATDLDAQGYVAHLTSLWANCPEALYLLSQALGLAGHVGGLSFGQRQLLITSCASAMGDSYCSLAGGGKLAAVETPETAAAVINGERPAVSDLDAALVTWARQMAKDPNSVSQADVDELRALGLEDRQIFAVTFYVALRIAFATVNDTLGAAPDLELANSVPPAVLAAVDFGRPPRP